MCCQSSNQIILASFCSGKTKIVDDKSLADAFNCSLRAIQIICETLVGRGGGGMLKCHQITWGRGVCNLLPFNFFGNFTSKGFKKLLSRHTRGVGRGGNNDTKCLTGGGGLKSAEKCHVLCEWPLIKYF
jgi:hypothetical protein